jgi:hypothetical protein
VFASLKAVAIFPFEASGAGGRRDVDYSDFSTQKEARKFLEQDPSDPNHLDGSNQDGMACESLP